MVKGNSDRFRQLLIFFISNAFKESSNVKVEINIISSKNDTSTIGLQFQDSGPGMSEEELDVCQWCSRSRAARLQLLFFRKLSVNLSKLKTMIIGHCQLVSLHQRPTERVEVEKLFSRPSLAMSEMRMGRSEY